ncbi:MAG: hypothetical protein JXA30_05370 [Deltaproteobacteria bacterium]|nr:hypothetical protein [Deltaproteobacteria bacterium]
MKENRKRKSTVPTGVFYATGDEGVKEQVEQSGRGEAGPSARMQRSENRRPVLDISLDRNECGPDTPGFSTEESGESGFTPPRAIEADGAAREAEPSTGADALEDPVIAEQSTRLVGQTPRYDDDDPIEIVAERIDGFAVQQPEAVSRARASRPDSDRFDMRQGNRFFATAAPNLRDAMKVLLAHRKQPEGRKTGRTAAERETARQEPLLQTATIHSSNKTVADSSVGSRTPAGGLERQEAPDRRELPVLRDDTAAVVPNARYPREGLWEGEKRHGYEHTSDHDATDRARELDPLMNAPALLVVEPSEIERIDSLSPGEIGPERKPAFPLVTGSVAGAATAIVLLAAATWAGLESRRSRDQAIEVDAIKASASATVRGELLSSATAPAMREQSSREQPLPSTLETQAREQKAVMSRNASQPARKRRFHLSARSAYSVKPEERAVRAQESEQEPYTSEPSPSGRAQAESMADLPQAPSREAVHKTLSSLHPELQRCVEDRPGLVEVDITIKSSGRVSHVVVGGDFRGTRQGSCIARTVRRARFEPFIQPNFRVLFPYSL